MLDGEEHLHHRRRPLLVPEIMGDRDGEQRAPLRAPAPSQAIRPEMSRAEPTSWTKVVVAIGNPTIHA